MIKVLAAALIGTVVGIAVMVVVIAVSTSSASPTSSLGLSLSTPVASTTSTPTSQPASGGSSSGGGNGQNPQAVAAGKTVFTGSSGCAGCHTLAAAGANGTIGPDLDKQLASDAQAAGMPLPAFIKESIVNPDAYIAKGYNSGLMPTNFNTTLSATDIDNLVALIMSDQH